MTEHYKKVDVESFHYKPICKNKKGSNVVYLSRSKGADYNPRVQLNSPTEPQLICPFGLSCYDNQANGRMTLDISLEDDDLVKWAQGLDDHNIATAIANKKTWFKAGTTDDQVKSMYYPLLQHDQEGKYAPKLHCKANTEPGKKQIHVIKISPSDNTYVVGSAEDLKRKFCKTVVIIEVGNIWFQKLQYGMTILAAKVIVYPEESRDEFDFVWGDLPVPVKATPPTMQDSSGPAVEETSPGESISILMKGIQDNEGSTSPTELMPPPKRRKK